jgi:heavy-metal resistance protein CzcE
MKKSAIVISIAAASTLSAAGVAGAAATTDLLGSAVQPSTVQRTVSIDRGTRWVSVRQGETVGFVANGQEFAWQFDGPVNSFNLGMIAPDGMIDHAVRIQVEPLSSAP